LGDPKDAGEGEPPLTSGRRLQLATSSVFGTASLVIIAFSLAVGLCEIAVRIFYEKAGTID
jgi:hypothetical protein